MKKLRTITVSMAALCIATILAIGGTYALFTDVVEVNNHLVAGNLKIGMVQTKLEKKVLDPESGLMVESTDDVDVDLVANGKKTFEYLDVVPTTEYTATIQLTNEGSTAFDYNARILWYKGTELTPEQQAAEQALAEQIQITITFGGEEVADFMLSECYEEENIVDLGTFLKSEREAKTLVIHTEFVDGANNNDAMLGAVSFDVQINAKQNTSLKTP